MDIVTLLLLGAGYLFVFYYFFLFKPNAERELKERIKTLRDVATKICFDKNSLSYGMAQDIVIAARDLNWLYRQKDSRYSNYNKLCIDEVRMLFLLIYCEKIDRHRTLDMIYKCLDKAKEIGMINEEIYAGELEDLKSCESR